MRADSPFIALHGGSPALLSAESAPRAVLTLPWAAGPLPGDPWLSHLLPRRDYNAALLDRLAETPPPPGAFVALFLADPLLRPAAVFDRLARLGIAGIAAFPGLSRFGAGFGDALAQAGLSPGMEAGRLAEARAAGFATLAAIWQGAAWPGHAPSPDHVLAPASARPPAARAGLWVYPARPRGRRARDLLLCARAPQRP
jgi:predicted TIM-barrel enzyme